MLTNIMSLSNTRVCSKMFSIYIILATTFILTASSCIYASDNSLFTTYENNAHKYLFNYPKTWKQVNTTEDGIDIFIISENGTGKESCEIATSLSSNSKDLTAKQYVNIMTKNTLQKTLQKGYPDVVVNRYVKSNMSGQEAYRAEFSMTLNGRKADGLILSSAKNGYLYSINCFAYAGNYDKIRNKFDNIINGFMFFKNE